MKLSEEKKTKRIDEEMKKRQQKKDIHNVKDEYLE